MVSNAFQMLVDIFNKAVDSIKAEIKERYPMIFSSSEEGDVVLDDEELAASGLDNEDRPDDNLAGGDDPDTGDDNQTSAIVPIPELGKDRIDTNVPINSKVVKEGESLIRSVLNVMTDEGDDTGRRYFDEIHQYPTDPSLTLGFAHFATGTATEFFSEMPEPIMNGMLSDLSALLLSDADYLAQFTEDYKELFPSQKDFSNEKLQDYLQDFFSNKGALNETEGTVIYKKHNGINRWADNRILKYAANHEFSQYLYYNVDTLKKIHGFDLNVVTWRESNGDFKQDDSGDWLEVSAATYSKNQLGAYRKDPDGTFRKFLFVNQYVESKKCKKGGNERFYAQKKALQSFVSTNWLSYGKDSGGNFKVDEFGDYIKVSERIKGLYRKVVGNYYVSSSQCIKIKDAYYTLRSSYNSIETFRCSLEDSPLDGNYVKVSLDVYKGSSQKGFTKSSRGDFRKVNDQDDVYVKRNQCCFLIDSESKERIFLVDFSVVSAHEKYLENDRMKRYTVRCEKAADGGFVLCSKQAYDSRKKEVKESAEKKFRKVKDCNLYVTSDSYATASYEGTDWFAVHIESTKDKDLINAPRNLVSYDGEGNVSPSGQYFKCSDEEYDKQKDKYVLGDQNLRIVINLRNKDGQGVYLDGNSLSIEEAGSEAYVKIKRGANLFPGYGKKNGYWFNDLMPYVLMRRDVVEWQLCFWCHKTLGDVRSAAKALSLDSHIGAQLAMASIRSSGGLSSDKMRRAFLGVYDCPTNVTFNMQTYSRGEGEHFQEDLNGDYLRCSTEGFSLDDKQWIFPEKSSPTHRLVLGTGSIGGIFVKMKDCIKDASSESYYVAFQSTEKGKLVRKKGFEKIAVNVFIYKKVGDSFVKDERGNYVNAEKLGEGKFRVGDLAITPDIITKKGDQYFCMFRDTECRTDNGSAEAIQSRENDLKALQIWMYYNKTRFEKGEHGEDWGFRGRQKVMYQDFFKDSWGDFPPFDSFWQKRMPKDTGGAQTYSNVKEFYAYTGHAMSTEEDAFNWKKLRQGLTLNYEKVLNDSKLVKSAK